MNTYVLEYELIDISLELPYELPGEESWLVREDGPASSEKDADEKKIVYDADGIPMGDTIPEIEARETIISDFLEKWGQANIERSVYNDILKDNIYVRAISVIEAKEHSSKSYASTRAVMIIDEVLKNASPIKRVPVKKDNRNQKDFSCMLVMLYKHDAIGSIKVTLGIRKSKKKNLYGLTALRPGQPLIDVSLFENGKKKKKRRTPK